MTAATAPAPWAARPRHIQRWVDRRNGAVRVYFRHPHAAKRIELKSPWGSQAMADEVATHLAALRVRPAPAVGTLVGAVAAYRGDSARGIPPSADYLGLAISTQLRYERWLDVFARSFDGVLLEDVNAAYVLALRDKWAPRGHEAANTALQVLKNVCKPAMITGAIEGDPFAHIEKVRRPQGLGIRNPRWEDTEVEAAIDATRARQPGLARAIALGRWGGFRKQTIVRVPLRARIERENGRGESERRIVWLTEKKEVLCDRREDIRLTELLSKTPNRALTIAYNTHGGPWTGRALSHALERLIKRLAKSGAMRETLTVHGLRHARGVEVAMAGGSDAEIMMALDHASPRAAQEYRRQADRLRLADSMQDRVDGEVIRLRAAREKRSQRPES